MYNFSICSSSWRINSPSSWQKKCWACSSASSSSTIFLSEISWRAYRWVQVRTGDLKAPLLLCYFLLLSPAAGSPGALLHAASQRAVLHEESGSASRHAAGSRWPGEDQTAAVIQEVQRRSSVVQPSAVEGNWRESAWGHSKKTA